MVGSRWIEVESQSKTCASRKIPRNLPMKAARLHPPNRARANNHSRHDYCKTWLHPPAKR